jgi:hypothetical protein
MQDVAEGLRTGAYQCFDNGRSVCITEILVFPRRKVLSVFLAAGELEDVLACVPEMEEFGRQHGCNALVCTGRKGWRKVLPKTGWRETLVSFARDL